jgi:hypothetical protein
MYFRNESGIVSWCCFSGIHIEVYRFPMIYHILHGLMHKHVEFQRSGHGVPNLATLHDTSIIRGYAKAGKVFIDRNNDAGLYILKELRETGRRDLFRMVGGLSATMFGFSSLRENVTYGPELPVFALQPRHSMTLCTHVSESLPWHLSSQTA